MAIFKCKMCGATLNIPKDTNVFKCEYCDTEQTVPIINSQEKEDLYERANYFFHNNEYDKAAKTYEEISNLDPRDPESYFMQSLCKYGIEYVEDSKSKKRIPTLHRLHFESISNDINYKKAINHADSSQKVLYESQAKYIDEVRDKILEISKKEKPYDVFICYKETDEKGQRTEDSVIAMDIYNELAKEGLKVFFSRVTLEGKLGVEYEPYIFAALNSAKVMVVVGTKPEYINSPWVRNEWTRFIDRVDGNKSNKKNAEKCFIVPAYKGISPYALPNEFSSIQAQDMAKVGAIQDLVHGIKKLLHKQINETNKIEITLNKKYKKIMFGVAACIISLLLIFAIRIVIDMGSTIEYGGKKYNVNDDYTTWTYRNKKGFEQRDVEILNKFKKVHLIKFYDSELENLEFLPKLENVDSVEFYNTKLNNCNLTTKCENIKVFKVPRGSNQDLGIWQSIKFMDNMPNLEEIQIPIYDDLSPISFHKKLEKIILYDYNDNFANIENFLWCQGLNQLKYLEIKHYSGEINLVDDDPLNGLEYLSNLETLIMEYISIKGKMAFGKIDISHLNELKNLRKLEIHLGGSWRSDYETKSYSFDELNKLTKLQELKIDSYDQFSFNGINHLKELETIEFRGQILDENLLNFRSLNKLKHIILEFKNFNDYGEKKSFSLSGVEFLHSLKELYIDRNSTNIEITDEDLIRQNTSIKYYKQ